MGGKKAGQLVLTGSLKKHWIRYINKLILDVNPTDHHGMHMSTQLTKMLCTIDSKFIQPGFEHKLTYTSKNGYYYPTIMRCTFVNGYQRDYNITMSRF